jgi:hypothetical protein
MLDLALTAVDRMFKSSLSSYIPSDDAATKVFQLQGAGGGSTGLVKRERVSPAKAAPVPRAARPSPGVAARPSQPISRPASKLPHRPVNEVRLPRGKKQASSANGPRPMETEGGEAQEGVEEIEDAGEDAQVKDEIHED